jgi:hypothetical protein
MFAVCLLFGARTARRSYVQPEKQDAGLKPGATKANAIQLAAHVAATLG